MIQKPKGEIMKKTGTILILSLFLFAIPGFSEPSQQSENNNAQADIQELKTRVSDLEDRMNEYRDQLDDLKEQVENQREDAGTESD